MADFEEKLLLIGLGAQKAGTTWLARYLGNHPEVYVSRLKELHYFDSVYPSRSKVDVGGRMIRLAREVSEKIRTDGKRVERKALEKLFAVIDRLQMTANEEYSYIKFFRERVEEESVFCDITPGYAMLNATGFEAMVKMHPRVCFIFLLRNPVDRYWSALRMGVRKMDNFDPRLRFMGLLHDEDYFFRSDYKRTIEELEKVAKPEQIKYIFYENLFNETTIGEITSFIGVHSWPAEYHSVVNAGAPLPLENAMAAAAYIAYKHVYDFVFDRFGDATPMRWRETVALANKVNTD